MVKAMEIRRWKAFLRLEGDTSVEKDEDIMNEFKGFAQALNRVGIDYSIVVNVEVDQPERLTSRPKQAPSMTHGTSYDERTERVGG